METRRAIRMTAAPSRRKTSESAFTPFRFSPARTITVASELGLAGARLLAGNWYDAIDIDGGNYVVDVDGDTFLLPARTDINRS